MTASDPTPTPAQLLATPVQFLKGVGPARGELLERLGLRTVRDVLFFFPRDYQEFSEREVNQLEEGKLQSVRGVVEDIDQRTTGAGGCVLGVSIRCRAGQLRALWFNQPFMRDRFTFGQRVMLSGKPKYEGLVWQMHHPQVETLDQEEEEPVTKILPVYPLTEGLLQWQMRKIVRGALETHAGVLEEVFPEQHLQTHDLWPLRQALPQIHFPADQESLDRARRRLVYQELLILQLALAVRRQQQHDQRTAPALEATAKIDARIRRLFPFELTAGQQRAIAEIAADMAGPLPMNRLLQGDVGSGKTVVAVYAMLLAVAHGYQAVLMAPTEVLARQHVLTLERMLAASQVRRASLTGGLTAAQRAALLQLIAAGEVDLVVGTQAIIQEDVSFAKLGLVVIDEQHKFGVRQRATLKQAGTDPHYLVMTATPIPRSVTMTLFGDLDVSTLPRQPAGPAEGQYLSGQRGATGQVVGFFSQEAPRGPAGVRRHAAGRGIGRDRGGQPGRNLRSAGQRRVGGLSAGADPRPDDAGRKRRRDGRLPLGRRPGAGLHFGGRGGRGRAQRHADDDRGWPSLRSGPASPASRPDQPRQVSRLLLRVRRSADRRIAGAAEGVRRVDRRFRVGGDGFPAARPRRHLWHEAARPAAAADCRSVARSARFWKKPAATPRPSWPPIPVYLRSSTRSCGG